MGARYALVLAIETDAEDVDIWTPVAQQIGIPMRTWPLMSELSVGRHPMK
jgi:hypothetical protein